MDKEILEILKEMQKDMQEINKKLDGITDQTANLTEFRTTVLDKLQAINVVEEVTKANCYEIAKLKIVK